MRYFEIAGGIRIPTSEDEREVIDIILENDNCSPDEGMDEYQQELCQKMVSRGLLNRLQKDGKIYYTTNYLPDVWRI